MVNKRFIGLSQAAFKHHSDNFLLTFSRNCCCWGYSLSLLVHSYSILPRSSPAILFISLFWGVFLKRAILWLCGFHGRGTLTWIAIISGLSLLYRLISNDPRTSKKIRKVPSCSPLDPRSSHQVAMASIKRSNLILNSSSFQVDTQRRVRRCPWKSLVSILVGRTSVWTWEIPCILKAHPIETQHQHQRSTPKTVIARFSAQSK